MIASSSEVVVFFVSIAVAALVVSMIVVMIANYFLKREPTVLLFSTSIVGTLVYLLSIFAALLSLALLVRWHYIKNEFILFDVWNYLFIFAVLPAIVCMTAWLILIPFIRTRTSR